ncbi:MAG TPA: hypothetical protein VI997_07760, partial [Candidatus Thermoplasmatota archaeon]|nr:hypothetical protein [Candidatus Thermoplasmatota archaeon]
PTEVLALSAVPAGALVDDPRATADRLAEAGTRVRTILQIPDLAMAEDCAAHAEAKPSEEYRHLPLRGLLQAWLFDDREAFLVITRGGDDPARSRLLVHTTVRVTLLALRGELEKLWEKAEPLERRLEALRRLPRHLQVDMALQGGLLAAVSAAHEDLGGAYAVLEDERIVSASPAWTARSGWAFGELVALPSALDAFAPDARADAALRLSGAPDAPSGEPWETVLLAKDGGRIECVAVLRPVGESRQIVLAWRDVTAERRAERALREEAQRLFEAAGLSPVPILPRGTEARPRIR